MADATTLWFLGLLCLFSIFSLILAATRHDRSSARIDHFVGGRLVGPWSYGLGLTATILGGLFYLPFMGGIVAEGLPFATLTQSAVLIAVLLMITQRRTWVVGKRYGYLSQGEMLYDYFDSDLLRIGSAAIAVILGLGVAAIQLSVAGPLVEQITDGWLTSTEGHLLLTFLLGGILLGGGFRGLGHVTGTQGLFAIVTLMMLMSLALERLGGFAVLQDGLASIAASDLGPYDTTLGKGGGDFNALFAIPGLSSTIMTGEEAIKGASPWSAIGILTWSIALAGMAFSPAASSWALSLRHPSILANQQVWLTGFAIGGVGAVALPILAMSYWLLGSDPIFTGAGIALEEITGEPAFLPLQLLEGSAMADGLKAALAVAFLSGLFAAAIGHLKAAATAIVRDITVSYINPDLSAEEEVRLSRFWLVGLMVIAFILVELTPFEPLSYTVTLMGLALQLAPAILALCWFPQLTRRGVELGFVVGIILCALTLTPLRHALPAYGVLPQELAGPALALLINQAIAYGFSAWHWRQQDHSEQLQIHGFLRRACRIRSSVAPAAPLAIFLMLTWSFLALGPGVVIGNYLFGDPSLEAETWYFGIPSLWVWQIGLWLLAIPLLAFIGYGLEQSAPTRMKVEAIIKEDEETASDKSSGDE